MTDEEIVALAFKHWLCKSSGEDFEGAIHSTANVIAFARAIAAQEREECARVCENIAATRITGLPNRCAAAIRARGDKP